MSQTPLLSIVIPSFNYARYLPDCLDSIFTQVDPPEFEVVIVDDGSTDHTVDVLRSIQDARVRVVRHERNRGHVVTINEALPLARGAIVARIDPDDRYRPEFMSTVCRLLTAHPDVGLVYGNAAIIDALGHAAGRTSVRPHVGDFKGSEFIPLLERNFICAPTVAARREMWIDALPVPHGLAFNDWYFSLMAARRRPCYFVDQVLAEYRVHGANHHATVSRNRSEERSVLWLLDRLFSQVEAVPEADAAKRRARRGVYAAHYLDFADKYFGFGMTGDARRCYLAAVRHRPSLAGRATVARRLLASLTSRRVYEGVKTALKPDAGPGGTASVAGQTATQGETGGVA
jgi:glycosyltransferase involved in cell wall biosynthesis